MALDFLARMNSFLGPVDKPEEEMKQYLSTERAMREFDAPTEREKFDYSKVKEAQKQSFDSYKLTLSVMQDALSKPNVSPATADYLYALSDHMMSAIPPQWKPALAAVRSLRFLSDEERNGRRFDSMFPPIPNPKDENGVDLPVNEENEAQWAGTILQRQAQRFKRAVAMYGKDKGSAYAPPAMIQVLPSKMEGEKRVDPDLWFLEPRTQTPMRISSRSLMLSDEQMKEFGWSRVMSSMYGGHPTSKPMDMVVDGEQTRAWSFLDYKTGQRTVRRDLFGPAPATKAPDWLSKTWMAAASGDSDAIGQLKGGSGALAKFLNDFREFDNIADLKAAEAKANKFLEGIPGYKFFLDYSLKKDKKGNVTGIEGPIEKSFFGPYLDSRYEFKDFPWKLVPVGGGKVTLFDSEGTRGEFWRGRTKDGKAIALQGNGEIIPGTVDVKDNQIVPGITIPRRGRAGGGFGKPPTTLGDVYIRVMEGLESLSPSVGLREAVEKEVLLKKRRNITITDADIARWAKKLGVTVADFVRSIPEIQVPFTGE